MEPLDPSEYKKTGNGDFKFKYVAEEELLRIVRKVRREKRKEKDMLLWKRFTGEIHVPLQVETTSQGTESYVPPARKIPEEQTTEHSREPELPHPVEVGASSEIEPVPVQTLPPKRSVSLNNENYVTSRENGSLQRVAVLRYRMGLALDSLSTVIQCRPTEPDGPEDLERRRTRSSEFLSRFSRNYLFQLRMQIAELRRQIVCASSDTPGRHTQHQALLQKLVAAHQTAVQSLQAYLNQLPGSLHKSSILGKLQDLLCYLCDLSVLKNQLESYPSVDDFREVYDSDEIFLKCKDLMVLVDEKRLEMEGASVSAPASSPPSVRASSNPPGLTSRRSKPRISTHQAPGAGSVRPSPWKRSASQLARSRFGPPSSVRSSNSAHASSRGPQSVSNRNAGEDKADVFTSVELKSMLEHMHEVLCNTLVQEKKKKGHRKHRKSHGPNCRKPHPDSKCGHQPLTEVHNLASNVQLVITKHPDSDNEFHRSVGTDTADIEQCPKQDCRRRGKKVGWSNDKGKVDVQVQADNSCCSGSDEFLGTSGINGVPNSLKAEAQCKVPHQHAASYRDRFHAYKNHLQNPLVQTWCDSILSSVFQEVSRELEPSLLLENMYQLEFQDN